MSYQPSYVAGDWKAICQRCGRVFKGSQLMRTWDGLYVCKEDWEPKHPQLQVRGVRDDQRPPFTVPDPTAGQGPETWEAPTIANVKAFGGDGSLNRVSTLPTSPYVGQRVYYTPINNMLSSNGSSWFYPNGLVYTRSLWSFIDNFIDTDGTRLENHTAPDGSTWIKHPEATANLEIQSNMIHKVDSGTAIHTVVPSTQTSDYWAQTVINIQEFPAAGSFGIVTRWDPTVRTGYLGRYDLATNAYQLIRVVNGNTANELANVQYSVTNGSNLIIRLDTQVSNISLYIDGVLVNTVVDSNITNTGCTGFRTTGSDKIYFDYFEAKEI